MITKYTAYLIVLVLIYLFSRKALNLIVRYVIKKGYSKQVFDIFVTYIFSFTFSCTFYFFISARVFTLVLPLLLLLALCGYKYLHLSHNFILRLKNFSHLFFASFVVCILNAFLFFLLSGLNLSYKNIFELFELENPMIFLNVFIYSWIGYVSGAFNDFSHVSPMTIYRDEVDAMENLSKLIDSKDKEKLRTEISQEEKKNTKIFKYEMETQSKRLSDLQYKYNLKMEEITSVFNKLMREKYGK
jgi:hypothetical protein